MIQILRGHWIVLMHVLALLDILIMELKYVSLVIILGFLILIIINQSYECSVSPTHCTSCDDLNTQRELITNTLGSSCICIDGYFNIVNEKIC